MESNPYQPPVHFATPPPLVNEAEAIRREHISRESTIKTLGALQVLGGIVLLISAISILGRLNRPASILTAGFCVAFGIFGLILGLSMRRLRPWSRWGATVTAVLGLLAFPVGTLINALILAALLTPKSTVVFSPAYKEIIAATPHVKIRTSPVVWGILILFLLLIIGGAAWFAIASSAR